MADTSEHVVKITADVSGVKESLDSAGAGLDNLDSRAQKTSKSFTEMGKELERASKGATFAGFGDEIYNAFVKARQSEESFFAELRKSMGDNPTAKMSGDLNNISIQMDGTVRSAAELAGMWEQAQIKLAKYEAEATVARNEIERIRSEIAELNAEPLTTAAFQEYEQHAEKTWQSLAKLYEQRDKLQETGAWRANSKAVKSLEYEINNLETELDRTEKVLQTMDDAGEKFDIPATDQTIAKLNSQLTKAVDNLEKAESQAKQTADAINKIDMSNIGSISTGGIVSSITSAISPVLGVVTRIGSGIVSGLKSVASTALNILKNLASTAWNVVKNIASTLWNTIKNIVSSMANLAKSIAKAFGNAVISGVKKFTSWLGKAAKNMLGFNKETKKGSGLVDKLTSAFNRLAQSLKSQVVRAAARAILDDVEEVLGQIAQISVQFNTSMSGMIDSAKALGAQLVAIAEPLINAVAPAIEWIADQLTGLSDTVAQFVARLTGNDTYVKASKGQSDYAASIDDTTDSTKAATKATREYQNTVLGFDELNKLNSASYTDANAESLLGISDAKLAKAQTQATALNELADAIYNAWKNKDFYEVGRLVGEGVNEIFEALDRFAGWDYNADKITKWMYNAVDAINGFIEGFDGERVGTAIGDVINTIVESVRLLVDPDAGIDFAGLGRDIGEALASMLKKIDWYTLGEDIILGIQGLVTMINNLLEQDVGAALGRGLSDGIKGLADDMDPDTWSDLIANLFNNFMDFFTELFAEPESYEELGRKIGNALGQAFMKIDWTKLGTAMTNAFKSVSSLIGGLTDGLAKGLELDDDTTLATAIGEGIVNAIQGVIQWLNDNLFGSDAERSMGAILNDFFEGVFGAFDADVWSDLFDNVGAAIATAVDDLFGDTAMFATAGQDLGDLIVSILGTGAEEGVEEATDETDGPIIRALKTVGSAIEAFFTGFTDTGAWQAVKEWIVNGINNICELITGGDLKDAIGGIITALNDAFRSFFDIDDSQTTMDWIAEQIGTLLKKAVSVAFGGIGETIQGGIADIFVTGDNASSLQKAEDVLTTETNDFAALYQELQTMLAEGPGDLSVDQYTSELESLAQQINNAAADTVLATLDAYNEAEQLWDDNPIQAYLLGVNSTEETMDENMQGLGKLLSEANAQLGQYGIDIDTSFDDILETINSNRDETEKITMESAEETYAGMDRVITAINESAAELSKNHTLLDSIEEFFTNVADRVSKFISTDSSGVKIGGIMLNAGTITYSVIPELAGGGVLKDGTLFIANESGPELVGTDNSGSTAVMNNTQIVDAVSAGVRDAVTEALLMSDNGGDAGGNTEIVLRIDSEELARATIRGETRLGKRTNTMISFA